MKKYILFCAGIGLAMAFTSCGSSEKAYRKAYEKAQAQAQQQVQTQPVQQTQVTETPVVTPVQTVPSTQTQVVDNRDNVQVRQERVSIVSGSGLQNYSGLVLSDCQCRGLAAAPEECRLCRSDCEERGPQHVSCGGLDVQQQG